MDNHKALEQLQRDINQFTVLKRNHYLPRTEENEDDTAHSFSVAMIAWHIHHLTGSLLSLEKILKYALVHDFVELHAGDVNTFATAEARAQKLLDEKQALEHLRRDYANRPDLMETLEAYEAQLDKESQFVWACDNIQGLIQGQLDDWRCYYEYGVSDAQFNSKLDEYSDRMLEPIGEIFDQLTVRWRQTFHNSLGDQ